MSVAKVAYLPLYDAHDRQNIIENTILAIDLDSVQLLKKIEIGNGVGAVFLNKLGDKLYASAEDDNKIALIDTTTLTVIHEWTNLAIKPEQILLNNNDSILYFSEYNNDTIYQIDLVSNQISIALILPGFESFWYAENLNTVAFKTLDSLSGDIHLHFYDLNTFNLKFVRLTGDTYSYFLDEDGLRFYFPVFGAGRLYSKNLNNLVDNWYFSYVHSPSPIGGLNDTFSKVFPLQSNKILTIGWHGSYEVDRDSGVGIKISDLANSNHPYQQISDYVFLTVNRPQLPICIPLLPGQDCHNYSPLIVTVQNHQTNQETIVYEKDRAGTLARGRYVGDLFYSVPTIPLLNLKSLVFLLMFLVLALAYKTRFSLV